MKKFTSIMFLCGIMLCAAMGTANAQTSGTTGPLTWSFNTETGVLTITGEGAMPDYDGDYSPWYNYRESILEVIIGKGVKGIGAYAFYYCSGLTAVTIPESVTTIGEWAFSNCSGLTSITIPNSVTTIEIHAFIGCTGLTSIDVVSGNTSYSSENGVLFNKNKTTLIQYLTGKIGAYTIPNSVTTIGKSAFESYSGLTSIIIPESVTTIEDGAFRNCSGLTSVTIGNSVTTIGERAFHECSGLTSITIPNSVTTIGSGTFNSCSSLTSVTIPESVTTIEGWAFAGCISLIEVINYATTPQTIDGDVFYDVDISACTLRVPENSLDAYRNANVWKNFGTIVGIPATSPATSPVTGVNLNKTELSLNIGSTETLVTVILPANASNQNVTWSSNTPAVATVDDAGLVTAISKGTAVITVTTEDGGFTATCEVTVTQSVTGVTLNKTELSLKVNQIETLVAIVLPTNATNQAVTWESSNTAIATVDNAGLVTAVSKGTATITVTTEDGEFTDECTVTVTPVTFTISLSANPSAGGEVSGDGDYMEGTQATVIATPNANYIFVNWAEDDIEVENANATYTFTVTGNRTLVANFALQQFEVTYSQPEHGTLTVTAGSENVTSGSPVNYNTDLVITATPDEGYKLGSLTVNGVDFASGGTHTVTGSVNIECTFTDDAGISDNMLTGITVYGNGNTVYIVNKNSVNLKLVQIIDVLGRVVYTRRGAINRTPTAEIPINGTSGIYIIRLVSEDNKTSHT